MTPTVTISPPDAISEALNGNWGDDQQRIAEAGVEWLYMLLRKNMDYGSAVWKGSPLAPHLSPGDTILVRIGDKIARLESLANSDQPAQVQESFEDTLKDLAGYVLLWLSRPE
mgnify:CR=1 FL=1